MQFIECDAPRDSVHGIQNLVGDACCYLWRPLEDTQGAATIAALAAERDRLLAELEGAWQHARDSKAEHAAQLARSEQLQRGQQELIDRTQEQEAARLAAERHTMARLDRVRRAGHAGIKCVHRSALGRLLDLTAASAISTRTGWLGEPQQTSSAHPASCGRAVVPGGAAAAAAGAVLGQQHERCQAPRQRSTLARGCAHGRSRGSSEGSDEGGPAVSLSPMWFWRFRRWSGSLLLVLSNFPANISIGLWGRCNGSIPIPPSLFALCSFPCLFPS
eukprot:TRINITY_DN18977_c0_g5_i2.p1 TRINITY_DN18977_c0_g5~~TRINITY_DN18977_c0_g5_i2.p1  ORF type:complete len:275 (-),score=39.05 TRINITY_DN18977_c0_g5_i2:166-990(-)